MGKGYAEGSAVEERLAALERGDDLDEFRDTRRTVRLHLDETLIVQPRERLTQRHEREAETLREREHGELFARSDLAGEDRSADHVRGDLGLGAVRLRGDRVGESAAADAARWLRAGEGLGFCHLIFDVI